MKKSAFLVILLTLVLFPSVGHADIFDKLAGKVGGVGGGLRQVGLLIAGFGLIAFSVAAIFNKISWKTLVYIMLSTAVLSGMTAVIAELGGDASYLDSAGISAGYRRAGADMSPSGNVDSNRVSR